MTRLLSKAFRSLKPHIHYQHAGSSPNPNSVPNKPSKSSPSSPLQPVCNSQLPSSSSSKRSKLKRSWSVYLILSTNIPIKTYVGVTTNFSRRLRQHNGELKGGAKSSRRVGRPWVCACIIKGFVGRSEACAFESQWKIFSRKLPRKKEIDEAEKELVNLTIDPFCYCNTVLDAS